MSYKIEITAGTMTELAGKLLAMAATMQTTASDPVMPEVREATKPAKKAKPAPVVEEEVGNEPAAAAAETVSSESDTATAQPDPSDTPGTPQLGAPFEESSASIEQAPGAKALDFDKDIAPLVLKVVAEKGKPVVQDILAQFGVERASQVPDAQMNELVAVLKDAL